MLSHEIKFEKHPTLPYQIFKRYFLVDAILASEVDLIILGTDGQTLLPILLVRSLVCSN